MHTWSSSKRVYLFFFSINALSKQKRAMRCTMHKPCKFPFKHFSARITELKNYLPIFPGSSASKKMTAKELNKILLHAVPDSSGKKFLSIGTIFWDEELQSYMRPVLKNGSHGKIYEVWTTYKNPIREYANRVSRVRKQKGGEDFAVVPHIRTWSK